MKNKYRLNVRFDCSDEKQRELAERLQEIGQTQHTSINSFVIEAIRERFERAEEAELLADLFRKVLREELQDMSFSAPLEDAYESAAGNEGNDASVLEALAMFE